MVDEIAYGIAVIPVVVVQEFYSERKACCDQ